MAIRTLTTALCVERPYIVVYCSGFLLVHVLVEDLAAEEWDVPLSIEWPVQ